MKYQNDNLKSVTIKNCSPSDTVKRVKRQATETIYISI